MAGIPAVSVADVAIRYDGVLEDEFRQDYLEQQIKDAVAFTNSRWGALIQSRFSTGALVDDLYKRTIADGVLRVIRNPGGLASENEGGYGYSTRVSVASGNLWFTQDDIANLIGVSQSVMPGTVGIGLDRGWR